MSNYAKVKVTCQCGSTVQQSSLKKHRETMKHKDWMNANAAEPQNIDESIPRTTKFTQRFPGESEGQDTALRYTSRELRKSSRVNVIQALRQYVDPYTKRNLDLSNAYDVDHIHEVQVLIYAINHTPPLSRKTYEGLREEINNVSNLVITDPSINRSKGQAIRYFLNHLDTKNEFSLLFALVQESTGDQRQTAPYSRNIVDLINETSTSMSNHIREIRRNNGHVTGGNECESIADQYDSVIRRMDLDLTDGIKLRSGRTYYPPTK
jgi:hypothetical protein